MVTSEVMLHKNPTVRGTVSRLLAYLTERHGVDRILSGQREVTERVVPAVAKLAQDGSQVRWVIGNQDDPGLAGRWPNLFPRKFAILTEIFY